MRWPIRKGERQLGSLAYSEAEPLKTITCGSGGDLDQHKLCRYGERRTMSKETPKMWKRHFIESRLDESLKALQEAQRLTSKNGVVPREIARRIDTLITKTEELRQALENWPQRNIRKGD
jgi:hypothetical protein